MGLLANVAAGLFGFTSGVVRNARTFHPDGRVFRGTARSLEPGDRSLASAARALEGAVLLRMGMGVVKRGMPAWLANHLPDAPSIAMRFHSAAGPGELGIERRAGEDLDLLCTAGGDRLSKLVLNLSTGGRKYGLQPFDYFRNFYYAQVPYRIDDGRLDVWVRLAPPDLGAAPAPDGPHDAGSREEALTRAVARQAVIAIEVQRVGRDREPFVPIAEIRFEEEVEVDQEALHFDPVAGRGFEPHGFYTELRKKVYPSSTRRRPHSREERAARAGESVFKRLGRYFGGG
jgi:hypothetical protein